MQNGFRLMDSDMHIIEPVGMWEQYIDSRFQDRAPKIVGNYLTGYYGLMENHMLPTVDSHARERFRGMNRWIGAHVTDHAARGFDAACQLEAMDREGIDIAILYPTIGLYVMGFDDLEPQFAAAICRAYNNWLYDFCQRDPERLRGAAMIPPHDITEALQETRRAIRELGFAGVFLHPSTVNGRQWHDRYFDPLWYELQELDVPVGFHEGTGTVVHQPGDQFGKNRLMMHAASHPIAMMYTSMSLIIGGVLEVFPRLRVGFLECNVGWVPFWLDRLNRDYERLAEWDAPTLTMQPSAYLLRQCWVGAEEERGLQHVVAQIGDDNIVWSTDYPHWDSDYPHASQEFLELAVSDDTKRKILWDNCARLYGLEAAAASTVAPAGTTASTA
jgi:predicted TIM-barrel fold metal-dependent hydrolase